MIGLTAQQSQLKSFIQSFQTENFGVSPSFHQMAEAMGLTSKASIHRLLDALEERGHLYRIPNRARAIEVIAPASPLNIADALRFASDEQIQAELGRRQSLSAAA